MRLASTGRSGFGLCFSYVTEKEGVNFLNIVHPHTDHRKSGGRSLPGKAHGLAYLMGIMVSEVSLGRRY